MPQASTLNGIGTQCCAILIGIGAISVLKSKIFDTFGIVSVLVLKEVCKRYWYWSRYCKKSLRGIGIGIGIDIWLSEVLVSFRRNMSYLLGIGISIGIVHALFRVL